MNQIRSVRRRSSTSQTVDPDAEEERRWAARLQRHCGDEVLLLHHRRSGVDRRDQAMVHVAVTPSGVVVIDAKDYADARVTVRRRGGLLSPPTERLFVHGLDSTRLLSALAGRQQLVARAVVRVAGPDVPVTSMLCVVNAQLPVLGTLEVQGVPVRSPRDAGRLLRRSGPFGPARRRDLWAQLAEVLPPA